MDVEQTVADYEKQAQDALRKAAGMEVAPPTDEQQEEHGDSPEVKADSVPGTEQPAVTENASNLQNSEDINQQQIVFDGLTLDNAKERLKNADSAVRGAQKKMTEATQEASDLRREVAALQNVRDQQTKQVAMLEAEVAMARSESTKPAEPAAPQSVSKDAIDEIREQYGSDFDPMFALIEQQEGKIADLSGRLESTQTQSQVEREERERKEVKAQWRKAIVEEVPDAFDIAETPEFHGWLERQPQMIKETYLRGDAPDVIYMMNLYKKAVGSPTGSEDLSPAEAQPTAADRQSQLLEEARGVAEPDVASAAVDPTESGIRRFTPAEIALINQEQAKNPADPQWPELRKQIELAMRTGNVY